MNKKMILDTNLLPEQAALYYLGQVGLLIQFRGKFILVDGYLSDSVDRMSAGGPVVWKRNYPWPVRPSELDFVDYVFCTHAHTDHADPDTLSAIAAVNRKARFFGPAPVCEILPGFGVPKDRIELIRADETMKLDDDISVRAIPAAHEELHPDGEGSYEELGYIFSLDGLKVYHSGDCCPYDGLIERVKGCDAALMPINGKDYFRTNVQNIIGCFDSVEAITIAKEAGIGVLLPGHFDLYNCNMVNPAYFVDCIQRIAPGQKYHIFQPGERYILQK